MTTSKTSAMKSKCTLQSTAPFKPSSMPWLPSVFPKRAVRFSPGLNGVVQFSDRGRKGKVIGIYAIINVVSQKIYVGSSIDVINRLEYHQAKFRRGLHWNPHMQSAWDKYGEEKFEFYLIRKCGEDKLIQLEQLWISKLNAFGRGGYNMAPVAGSTRGMKLSLETRAKISAGQIGRVMSVESRAKLSQSLKDRVPGMLGKSHSATTRQKMSQSHLRRFQ
jgi:group I intron endonuclease